MKKFAALRVVTVILAFASLAFTLDRQPNAAYRARREALAKKTDGGIVVLFAPVERDDEVYGFLQQDNFFYLTGYTEPAAALLRRRTILPLAPIPKSSSSPLTTPFRRSGLDRSSVPTMPTPLSAPASITSKSSTSFVTNSRASSRPAAVPFSATCPVSARSPLRSKASTGSSAATPSSAASRSRTPSPSSPPFAPSRIRAKPT
jgi:hypothetical protein